MLGGGDVVGHLHHIVQWRAGDLLKFEEEEIGKGGLCALDLRGEHGLAPHIGVEEEMRIRKQGADAVEPPYCQRSPLEQQLPGTGDLERRLGRQRKRHKGTPMLPRAVWEVWYVPVASRFICETLIELEVIKQIRSLL